MTDAADSRQTDGMAVAIDFLERLRPGGPWLLTAIMPDGPIATVLAHDAASARQFIVRYNGVRGLYYSLNPTRPGVSKKASKFDIAAVEYIPVDLDPGDDETPEQAKTRYLEAISGVGLEPAFTVDSGNGLQAPYRLETPIPLPEPLSGIGPNGREAPAFGGETAAIIADIEARTLALTLRLGSVGGTQNIDRVLRLPGTLNLPNAAKKKAGRVTCRTALLTASDASYPLDAFPIGTSEGGAEDDNQPRPDADDGEDELLRTIRTGDGHGASRSEAVWFVACEMLRRGYARAAIVATLLNRTNRISDHIYDQTDSRGYAEKQVAEAAKQLNFAVDDKDRPYPTPANIGVALVKMQVELRYDLFAGRALIEGLEGFGPALDDAAVNRLWLSADRRFHFRPSKDLMFTLLFDIARLNAFHPVRDYLDSLAWDGAERLDRWLATYGGAEDSAYVRAVSALMLVAAVRRVRQPGCKFDEMMVIEHAVQGAADKSSALRALAVHEDWFSDDLPLNLSTKEFVEMVRGRWIIEASELSGLRRADINRLKAQLSRQVDRARMAYGRLPEESPRQCVVFATTNAEEYLRDTTGNRRYWPVRVQRFNLETLACDRDQLWAEAAAREATGASIRLDPSLWAPAEAEQAKRLTNDPYYEALQTELGDGFDNSKISSEDVWTILDVKPGARSQDQNCRMGEAMRKIGWRRPNASDLVRINSKLVVGYVRGEPPRKTVIARRSHDMGLVVTRLETDTEGT